VDNTERSQVRLVLEHLGSEYDRSCDEAQRSMLAKHAKDGLLRSGATIKASARIVEDQSNQFADKAIDQVTAVAQDVDAFNMILAELTKRFTAREDEFSGSVSVATAGQKERNASAHAAADRLFKETRERVFRRLELHRFSFSKPTKGDFAAMGVNLAPLRQTAIAPLQPKNAGGMPLAEHWDAMWAAIAVQLFTGDLDPKTQADIKRAMFAWFSQNEIEIGDTAVTQRARQLWQKLQAACPASAPMRQI
jgi:hypothetical protein